MDREFKPGIPVIVEGRVQGWTDKNDVTHGICGKLEPHRLLCFHMALWGYVPKLVNIEDVTCSLCKSVIDSHN